MKYIKLYNSFKIDSICKKYGIKNYTINSDGSIDVNGDVYLSNQAKKYGKDLTILPLKFGNVSGSFSCSENELTTLKGCPKSVGGGFYCNNNKLTLLEGCPQSVGSYFSCSENELTSLEGCPQSVGGGFDFSNNKLKDLYGFPEFFDSIVYYRSTPVSEILNLFERNRLGKVIDLLNEYGVKQQDGKLVILDRLEEVFYTLNMEIPEEINLKNYEVD